MHSGRTVRSLLGRFSERHLLTSRTKHLRGGCETIDRLDRLDQMTTISVRAGYPIWNTMPFRLLRLLIPNLSIFGFDLSIR